MTTEKKTGWFCSAFLSDQKRRRMERTAVITKGVGDITGLVGPVSDGDSPTARIGVSALNVLWDAGAFKPPERDLGIVPEHGDDTATSSIERTTSASREIGNGTAGVVTVRTRAVETKSVSEVTL